MRRRPPSRTSRRSWVCPRRSSARSSTTRTTTAISPSQLPSSCRKRCSSRSGRSRSGSGALRSSRRAFVRIRNAASLRTLSAGSVRSMPKSSRARGSTAMDCRTSWERPGSRPTYERWLRGTPGQERFLVNSDGEVLREFDPKPPEPGHDLRLALDVDVQRIAEEELLKGIQNARTVFDTSSGKNLVANAGAVVVLDPKTGGIVAMASWPSFSPSWFVKGRHGTATFPAVREHAGADAEPRHADHVRAGIDVQAFRGARRREGRDRLPGRVLRLSRRVRPRQRRVRHDLPQLGRSERRRR